MSASAKKVITEDSKVTPQSYEGANCDLPCQLRGSEWGDPHVGCRLKFSNFVGSRLKFSIFIGSRLDFSIFVGCRKMSVNK